MTEIFLKIEERIKLAQNILLTSHIDPDGDALGAMLGLRIALKKLGKKTDAFCGSKIPENLRLLPGAGELKREIDSSYDLVIGLDYGDSKRLETVFFKLPALLPQITFDHHPYLNQCGDLKAIDTCVSSTCEIICLFLNFNKIEIDKEMAVCLLTGIFADTWNLRHPNASAQTFKISGELLLKGVSLNKIIKIFAQNNLLVKSKIWGRGLKNIFFDTEVGAVFCFFSFKDLSDCGASNHDLSGLSSFIGSVPDAKFSLVLSEIEPGRLDGSLRAHPDKGIDVSQIARRFNGGGHKLSAGFKTNLKPEEVFKAIRNLIKADY